MIEIDCRKCENLSETCDSCKLYGKDPKKATAACKRDLFMHYSPQKKTPAKITPGTTVWVIERDEDGNATEVCGYLLLAIVAGTVIVSPKVYGMDTLAEIMEYHADEYAEFQETDLAVFPVQDCYAKKAEAMAMTLTDTEAQE